MAVKTRNPDHKSDQSNLSGIVKVLSEQSEMWQREARNAGVANHPMEEQYYLGIGAGLKRASDLIKAASKTN